MKKWSAEFSADPEKVDCFLKNRCFLLFILCFNFSTSTLLLAKGTPKKRISEIIKSKSDSDDGKYHFKITVKMNQLDFRHPGDWLTSFPKRMRRI